MIKKTYGTPLGSIHYRLNVMDAEALTLVFLPGLTADHRLFEKQIEYFENKYNVFVWDAPSHALSRPFTNNYGLSDMAEWLYEILVLLLCGHLHIIKIKAFKWRTVIPKEGL